MPGAPAVAAPAPPDLAGFCRELDAFAGHHIRASEIDRAGSIPQPILRSLAELGCFGISIPEAFGGAGLPLAGVCHVVATLAAHDRSVATTVGLHAGLGTRGLVALGTAAQQANYLPSLAAGRQIAAFAATEAGAGSDLTLVRTRASMAGGRLRLEGEKVFVTNGGLAGLFTVLASSPSLGDGRSGQSLVLVERLDRGVQILPEERKLGLRGSSTTGLLLEDLDLPPERILGQPGRGSDHAGAVLAWGRTVMAAGCLGASRRALQAALGHIELRHQFGRSLSRLEVVQEQVASLAAGHFAMSAILDDAAGAEAEAELARRSLVAKVFCSEENWRICDRVIQLHGGMGFIEDGGLPLLLRDARITRIFEGANDVLLVRLGAHEAARGAPGAPAGGLEGQIQGRVEELRERLGVRLLGQPRHLHRLGQLAVLREVSRAAVQAARRDPEQAPLADFWMDEARARALPLLREPLDPERMSAAFACGKARLAP